MGKPGGIAKGSALDDGYRRIRATIAKAGLGDATRQKLWPSSGALFFSDSRQGQDPSRRRISTLLAQRWESTSIGQDKPHPQNPRHQCRNLLSSSMVHSFSSGARTTAGIHNDRRFPESVLYPIEAATRGPVTQQAQVHPYRAATAVPAPPTRPAALDLSFAASTAFHKYRDYGW